MDKNHLIYKLYSKNLITKQRFDELQAVMHKEKLTVISHLLLTLGCTLILVGILFFIAANWSLIPSWSKLTGMQLLLFLSIATSFYFKEKKHLFNLFLMLSSMLVGLNLAVFGQVYQTGADAYTLFATWTLLITLWALFLQNNYLFIFWQGLLYLSIILFFNQYLLAFDLTTTKSLYFTCITISNIFLALTLLKNSAKIFSNRLTKVILLIVSLLSIVIPAIDTLFSHYDKRSIFIAILLFQSSLFFIFYHNKKMILEVTLILLNFLIFLEALFIKSFSTWYDLTTLLIFGLITIALSIGLGKLVKQLHRVYQGELV